MAAGGLQQLFDELKAVIAEADDTLARDAAADAPEPGVASTLRAGADRAAHSARSFVREHPWQAVGLALLAGFVAGAWVRRK